MQLPEDFLDSMKELLQDEYDEYIASFEKEYCQGIRVNTSKISVDDFLELVPFELEPIPWVKNGFYVKQDMAVTRHPYYYAGLYYVQEPSAMLPASRLPVEEGDKVLDLCAAPGGKATELGSRLNGTGLLVANDISNSRAKGLLKNLELFGIANIMVCSETPEKLCRKYENYFDKILIDAPCSGEGMFRKDPAMVKSYLEHGPLYYAAIQKEIVEAALRMLKPGGKLLYSTCTFSLSEDEEIIQWVLENHREMRILPMEGCKGFCDGKAINENEQLTGCIRIFPHRVNGEGHFAALLEKTDTSASEEFTEINYVNKKQKKENPNISNGKVPEAWKVFCEEYLERSVHWNHVICLEDRLYAMPENTEPEKGIRYLRTGLYLGDLKKNRFEPGQAFAMYLKMQECKSSISLRADDERVIRYLKGETVELTEKESEGLKAWCLVCVDGYPLGWAKWVNGSLRNKYYSGWRMC